MKKQAIGLLIGLVVQYILGMATNSFVKFPDTTNPGQLWQFAWSHGVLALHIVIGLFLLLGSLALMVRSIVAKDRQWTMISAIGFVAILLAGYGGSNFVSTQNDVYSFIMSLGFLLALMVYGWGVYMNK